MPSFNPRGFGIRLQEALEQRGWDIKTLHKAVSAKARGAKGTSYGTVWSYVKGQAPIEPRREVVEALAELLNRLPTFLMYGEGPKTTQDELLQKAMNAEANRTQAAETQATDEELKWFERFAVIAAGINKVPALWSLMSFPGGEGLFQGLVTDVLQARGESLSTWTAEEVGEAAYLLGSLIVAPAEALWSGDRMLGPRLTCSREGPAYFMAMVTAIRAALPSVEDVGPGWGPRFVLEGLRTFREDWERRFVVLASPLKEETDE